MTANKKSVYLYITSCCGVEGEKEPCRRTVDEKKDGDWGRHSLGTWRCSGCGNPAKVSRRKPQEKHA